MKSNEYLQNIAKAIHKELTMNNIRQKDLQNMPLSRSNETIWKTILNSSGEIKAAFESQVKLKRLWIRNKDLNKLVAELFNNEMIIEISLSDWMKYLKKDKNGRERLGSGFCSILTEKIQENGK
jgi:hypothetical protein